MKTNISQNLHICMSIPLKYYQNLNVILYLGRGFYSPPAGSIFDPYFKCISPNQCNENRYIKYKCQKKFISTQTFCALFKVLSFCMVLCIVQSIAGWVVLLGSLMSGKRCSYYTIYTWCDLPSGQPIFWLWSTSTLLWLCFYMPFFSWWFIFFFSFTYPF